MRYITELYRHSLVPDSINDILRRVFRRREDIGKPQIVDLAFDLQQPKFLILYLNGKQKEYNRIDDFLQAVGFSHRLGDLSTFKRYLGDPENYTFEEQLAIHTRNYLEEVRQDPRSFVDSLTLQITPFSTEENHQQLGYLWNQKFANIGLNHRLPKSLRFSLSCMDGSILARHWAAPYANHRLYTLENSDGIPFARTIVHLNSSTLYHNQIYCFEPIYPSYQADHIKTMLFTRFKKELAQLQTRPLDRDIIDLKDDFLLGFEDAELKISSNKQIQTATIVRPICPAVPSIDNPRGRIPTCVPLQFHGNYALVVPHSEATHFFLPFSDACFPLTKDQQKLVANFEASPLLAQTVTTLYNQFTYFIYALNHSLYLNPHWDIESPFYFDSDYLLTLPDYDYLVSLFSHASPQQILEYSHPSYASLEPHTSHANSERVFAEL